jgi:hypothetical protein
MMRFLVTIDELVALVRARAKLAQEGEQECVDALSSILADSALDVSAAD